MGHEQHISPRLPEGLRKNMEKFQVRRESYYVVPDFSVNFHRILIDFRPKMEFQFSLKVIRIAFSLVNFRDKRELLINFNFFSTHRRTHRQNSLWNNSRIDRRRHRADVPFPLS